jgi:hypothetical protein
MSSVGRTLAADFSDYMVRETHVKLFVAGDMVRSADHATLNFELFKSGYGKTRHVHADKL